MRSPFGQEKDDATNCSEYATRELGDVWRGSGTMVQSRAFGRQLNHGRWGGRALFGMEGHNPASCVWGEGAACPLGNAYSESFNGSLREECVNVHWFEDLTDIRAKMQAWQQEYNADRPHLSLKNLTPLQYKAQWHTQQSENR